MLLLLIDDYKENSLNIPHKYIFSLYVSMLYVDAIVSYYRQYSRIAGTLPCLWKKI